MRIAVGVGLAFVAIAAAACGAPGDGDPVATADSPATAPGVDPTSIPPTPEPTPEGPGPTMTEASPDPLGRDATAELGGMMLHLFDAPEGARIGDDSHCGAGVSTEGEPNAFLDVAVEALLAFASCHYQLEAPGVVIDSLVVSFPNQQLAARAMAPDAFAGMSRYYGLDCCSGDPIGSFVDSAGPGDQTLEAGSATDTVAVVGWRSGTEVGAVAVQRLEGAAGAMAEARRLAAVQHERMRSPVSVPHGALDDRLASLEVAPFQALWLGEAFTPPDLPAMELVATFYHDGLVQLDYNGIRLENFDLDAVPEGGETDQMLGLGQELFDSPCAVVIPVAHPDGDAALVGRFMPAEFLALPKVPGGAGWRSLNDDQCVDGDPNVWMATVRYQDSVLVRVNAPVCYSCLAPPDPGRPYHQPEGLRAVLTALTPFVR